MERSKIISHICRERFFYKEEIQVRKNSKLYPIYAKKDFFYKEDTHARKDPKLYPIYAEKGLSSQTQITESW